MSKPQLRHQGMMSLMARPSVICAIIFGCFAVLIPRIFLPLLRPRQPAPAHHPHEHFRRSSLSSMSQHENDDTDEQTPDALLQTRSAHPDMRTRHPEVDSQQPLVVDPSGSKSAATFALPMYTVGIAVFFLYTCFKYWTKRNSDENRIKHRYSSNHIQWNAHKRKFKYEMENQLVDNADDNGEDLYAGLDPEYIEYLRSKRQKEVDAEEALSKEQRQMHHTLDEMKHSLSFISSKLGATQTGNNLTNNEISQLQDRLASTEAQMCKIMNALDAASTQVNKLTQNARPSLKQPDQEDLDGDEHRHLSSRSQSESEDDDEGEDSDENSNPADDEIPRQEDDEEESSSSYEDEEEMPHEEDHDSESESSSERYGLMTTNYECDPATIDDYELDTIKKPDETTDSRAKVEEWHERNESQSLSSDHSATEQDQSIPNAT